MWVFKNITEKKSSEEPGCWYAQVGSLSKAIYATGTDKMATPQWTTSLKKMA